MSGYSSEMRGKGKGYVMSEHDLLRRDIEKQGDGTERLRAPDSITQKR